ncbi:MAG: YbaB/EbfC family nucleoid-associated protein [Anaerolineae bacterium]|nr:YbaB/EbfC family nucleoid-associated protein [Anaerolineae bacterium]
MAKGRRSDWKPGAAMGGGGMAGGQGGMMARVQKMQEEMKVAQSELENELVNVTSAGGAITITISGHQRVQSISIDPSLVDPNDVGMLEDALLTAVNEAIVKSQEHASQRLESITGGVSLPGMM